MGKVPEAAIEAAAAAIMSAQNANDDVPERFEANVLAKAALQAALPHLAPQGEDLATVRLQAERYLRAVHGEAYVYRAPETFSNMLERWIWAVAAGLEDGLGEDCMKAIESMAKEHRG